jgi:hypothetical protein
VACPAIYLRLVLSYVVIFIFSYTLVHMKNCCDGENNSRQYFDGFACLQHSSPHPQLRKICFWNAVYIVACSSVASRRPRNE